MSPEIEIKIKVYMCSRCGHLWERRRKEDRGIGKTKRLSLPITNCNSPYWNTMARAKGKSEKKFLPLRFHGEEVLDSNFEQVYGIELHKK